jgi:hypothetical protein
MTKHNAALFAVPPVVEPVLARVRSYWEGLLRGGNKIPFWDDVRLSSLADLAKDTMMLDAFDNPLRFRFAIIGRHIEAQYGRSITGKFLDEVEERPPIERLHTQGIAAVKHQSPTYFHVDHSAPSGARSYSRLVLPLWGEGRVSMLLATIAIRN